MKNIAIIGASENGIPWAAWLIASLEGYGFEGEIWPVNPNRATVFGRACFPSVDALPGTPGVAVVLLGAERAVAACAALAEAGCRDVVVVANGFRETGDERGRRHEEALRRAVAGTGTRLIGPNCVGFASFHDGLCAIAQPTPRGIVPGSVSVVSQSGGLLAAALGGVAGQGLGIDVCYSIGNGATFGLAAALRDAAERSSTGVVCAVVESIDDPAAVHDLAADVRAAGKHLVFLLLSQSEGAREVARSHTGAIVGEYRMVVAWLERRGVAVATSPEEMGRIAALLVRFGRPDPARGAYIATVSGGGAGMTGDLATRHGVPLANPAESTVEKLRSLLPAGGHPGNPLDVATGDAPAVYAAVAADPHVGMLVEPWVLPWPDGTGTYRWQAAAIDRVTAAGRERGLPVVVGSRFAQPPSAWASRYAHEHGILVTSDLERTFAALGRLHRAEASVSAGPAPLPVAGGPGAGRLVTEAEGREILAAAGLPIVAGRECAGIEEAARAGAAMAGPLVVKLSAPDVGHRDRVGGIRLGVTGASGVRQACAEIRRAAEGAGLAVAGFLVEEMVFGPEVLIGAVRDDTAGPTVTVAVGGWAAEAGARFGTLVLPVSEAELARALDAWGLPRLLGNARTDRLRELLTLLCAEFADGSLAGYSTVELNPVVLTPSAATIVDVLMVG